jgi:outer membrane PBP1 activator LpoA protein
MDYKVDYLHNKITNAPNINCIFNKLNTRAKQKEYRIDKHNKQTVDIIKQAISVHEKIINGEKVNIELQGLEKE